MLVLKNPFSKVSLLFLFLGAPSCIYSENYSQSFDNAEGIEIESSFGSEDKLDVHLEKKCKKHKKLSYYLYVQDFILSFIEIPTSNVLVDSTTISSRYLAGRAAV